MIKLLDKNVYNKIAAGEVVERPSSVVKELVENSIDANATSITIEIVNGGLNLIKVIDNGDGIKSDEIALAFMAHATSKISSDLDLEQIQTLGFRGEALGSIASVSKVEITSKFKDELTAKTYKIIDGDILSSVSSARENGVTMEISDLFYNTPARLKFMKSPRYESSVITSLVSNFILSFPKIRFKLISNKKNIYDYGGGDLEYAISTVYDNSISKQLLKLDVNINDIKINGYISKPSFTKSNRNYQTIIINYRVVKNPTISQAIMVAYGSYLMKSQFPVCILNIEIQTDKIDVNVHPTKAEVRFCDNQEVFRAIFKAISMTLENNDNIFKLEETEPKFNFSNENIKDEVKKVDNSNLVNLSTFNKIDYKYQDSTVTNFKHNSSKMETYKSNDENIKNRDSFNSLMPDSAIFRDHEEINVLGQVFKTYVLVEKGKNLYLIDSHAAHEKFLYEKYKKAIQEESIIIQPLLIPYIFTLNPNDYSIFLDKIDFIKRISIDIEELSNNTFRILSVPSFFASMNFDEFLNEILMDKNIGKDITISDFYKDKIASMACRAAVKANDKLSIPQIEKLIEIINDNKITQCPHGRPAVISLSQSDLEKMFRRIV